ncbi:MAG: replication and repair protein RecF [Candidatus Dependentiae bacterium]|nr:replication and repair protein RecF [Candidatus Dependentiae bacterium]
MRITHLTLRNFRCFESLELDITNPLLVIEGPNGSGKSSIAEALYYGCYLKSFRTHRAGDVVRCSDEGDAGFFLRLHGLLADGDTYTIQVGFEDGAKRIKVNDTVITTYKELMDYYKVVLISEHDLGIIQEGPEERRSFINQLCVLQDPTIAELLRLNKHMVSQRTQLLMNGQCHDDHFVLWTQQLWDNSIEIINRRRAGLTLLQQEINFLVSHLGLELPPITLAYKQKGGEYQDFASFWADYQKTTLAQEMHQRRTLFGCHLDDIVINFGDKNARLYASRGQQKLIVLLLKCAMIRVIQRQAGQSRTVLFVLDDFVTDLDKKVIAASLAMVQSLGCGIVVTCPLADMVQFSTPFQVVKLG